MPVAMFMAYSESVWMVTCRCVLAVCRNFPRARPTEGAVHGGEITGVVGVWGGTHVVRMARFYLYRAGAYPGDLRKPVVTVCSIRSELCNGYEHALRARARAGV